MSAVGVTWHAASVLRAALLTLGAFRHVLSTVAKHPMKLRLGRGQGTLAKIDIRPALAGMAEVVEERIPAHTPAVAHVALKPREHQACSSSADCTCPVAHGEVQLIPVPTNPARHWQTPRLSLMPCQSFQRLVAS